MFYYCSSLESIDLSSFNTSNVNNMSYIFRNCFSLQKENININESDKRILDKFFIIKFMVILIVIFNKKYLK